MTGSSTAPPVGAGNEAGFTLVELLVALALFSLLTTVLFENVRFGLTARLHGSVHAEQLERTIVAQDYLRQTIGNIYPMLVADGKLQPQIDFEGTGKSISFLGNAPLAAGGGGRMRFRVFMEQERHGTDLVVSGTPELGDGENSPMTVKKALLSDVDRVEFSYFGATASGRNAQWQDTWVQRSDPPALVRVRVGFRSEDVRLWPELVISPRITADVGCVYDLTTKRCLGR